MKIRNLWWVLPMCILVILNGVFGRPVWVRICFAVLAAAMTVDIILLIVKKVRKAGDKQ